MKNQKPSNMYCLYLNTFDNTEVAVRKDLEYFFIRNLIALGSPPLKLAVFSSLDSLKDYIANSQNQIFSLN